MFHVAHRSRASLRVSIAVSVLGIAAVLTLGACDQAVSPSATTGGAASPGSPQATRAVLAPAATAGPVRPPGVPANAQPLLYGCTAGLARCEDIAAGTYYTAGEWAFMPGLTFTLPSGWSSLANEAGELELHRAGDDHNEILVWRDVVPWHGDQPSLGQPPNPEAWIDTLQRTTCLLVSSTEHVVFGDRIDLRDPKVSDLDAIGITVDVAREGVWNAAGCPPSRLITILSDPMHWDHGFEIGGDEMNDSSCPCRSVQRLYFASIGYASHPHLLVVALQSFGPVGDVDAAMATLRADAQPILESLIAPAIVVDN